MTASITPFVLQFQRAGHVGLPYHGLVRNDALTLPGGGTKVYAHLADWVGGEAIAVAGSGAAVHDRTAAEIAKDAAKGHNWKPYALLSGIERNIGGHNLGEHAWLYNDGSVTWKLRAEIVRPATNDITIKIWLSSLFGYFSSDATVQVTSERLLASMAYVPLAITSYNPTTGTAVYGVSYPTTDADLFVAPKRNGSGCLISIGFAGPATGGLYFNDCPMGNVVTKSVYWGNGLYGDWTYTASQMEVYSEIPLNTSLSGVLLVTVSGTGSLEPGSVGSGISASIEAFKDMEDLDVVAYTPWVDGGGCPVPVRQPYEAPYWCEAETLLSTTTVETTQCLFSYADDGQPLYATITKTLTITPDDVTNDLFRNVSAVHSFLFEYAGASVEIVYASSGTQEPKSVDPQYIERSWTWDGATVTYPPNIWWDSALGDRTVLFIEFSWNNTTLYSYYISPGGTVHAHETAVSTLGADVPYPSIVKVHGFVSNQPVDDTIAYAGTYPNQCCYV